MDDPTEVLVLGIGNPLWGDEGFGLQALAALEARWRFPDGVRLLDGGTQGMYLLPFIRATRRLVVLDAVDFTLEPGTPLILHDDEVPRLMGARRLSLHQTTFQDVLAAAELLGGVPERMALVGVQCRSLEEFGGGLSDVVAAAIPTAIAAAVDIVAGYGFAPVRRTAAEARPKQAEPGSGKIS